MLATSIVIVALSLRSGASGNGGRGDGGASGGKTLLVVWWHWCFCS